MKTYKRKPLTRLAFKWDGLFRSDGHVSILGEVLGDSPCKQCGEFIERHGELTKPYDSVYSILCVGRWVLIREDGTTEIMSETQFRLEYEEVP